MAGKRFRRPVGQEIYHYQVVEGGQQWSLTGQNRNTKKGGVFLDEDEANEAVKCRVQQVRMGGCCPHHGKAQCH